MPPRTSRPTVEPRSEILKKRATPPEAVVVWLLTEGKHRRPCGRSTTVSAVEPQDDQPMQHEIGNRTYFIADVEPMDVDGVRTVEVGSALWLVAFVALLPFYGRLEESGRL